MENPQNFSFCRQRSCAVKLKPEVTDGQKWGSSGAWGRGGGGVGGGGASEVL